MYYFGFIPCMAFSYKMVFIDVIEADSRIKVKNISFIIFAQKLNSSHFVFPNDFTN